VLLSLGANLGEPLIQLRDAVDRIGGLIHLQRLSKVYLTEPVGLREQPDFYNLVCQGRTELAVLELFAKLQEIERGLGRERRVLNGPRRIDIDLLAYGDLVLDSPELVVPHPRMHQRGFVLIPLREIAPDWHHPGLGGTASDHLARLPPQAGVRTWGDLPGYEGVAANGRPLAERGEGC
jgi:2-amino-4-hydroxy-6-hydroxymethyldihydropteridine diphosphokinase